MIAYICDVVYYGQKPNHQRWRSMMGAGKVVEVAWIGNLWGMIVNGVEVVNVRVILGIRKNIIICPT
jgi:hypothetical protein